MNDLSTKVYELLKENNISNSEMLDTLSTIYKDLEISLWETINISPMMFYSLKDIVWYNLEHVPKGGETNGVSSLRYLGTAFPHLIYACNENDVITCEEAQGLLNELDEISLKWNTNWKFVSLYTKSSNGWKGGDNPSKIIIYDAKAESPSKFGYNSSYGSIVDSRGNKIAKHDLDTVLCAIDISIGEYVNSQILFNLIIKLKEVCKKSLKNKRDIKVIFEQYNLNNYED